MITVSSIKKFAEFFRQSLVIELYWEDSIQFKMLEKNHNNYQKISRLTLLRKFISKIIRNIIR